MAAIAEEAKKRLGTEDEPFEGDVPNAEIEKDIIALVEEGKRSGKRATYVFDGFTHAKAEEFISFVSEFGPPDFAINCSASAKCIEDRYKKKNEVDEIPEEAAEELKAQEAAHAEVEQAFEAAYASLVGRVQRVDLPTDCSLESTQAKLA